MWSIFDVFDEVLSSRSVVRMPDVVQSTQNRESPSTDLEPSTSTSTNTTIYSFVHVPRDSSRSSNFQCDHAVLASNHRACWSLRE